MKKVSYFLIHIGENRRYIEEARKDGFIAIGWNNVPDLRTLKNTESIKLALQTAQYNYTPRQLALHAGQIARFGLEMKLGDIVLSPLGGGEFLVGDIDEYYYEKLPKGECKFAHRRHVKWRNKTIQKRDMSTQLAYSVGGILTLFSLDKYADELGALVSGQPLKQPTEKHRRVRDIVITGLLKLDGRGFEEFIKHLLEILGFEAETSRYVRDGGIDVTGSLDAEGLAQIHLRVQAKRYEKGSIGPKVIRELRGVLSHEEQGCVITTSTFNREAVETASQVNVSPIRLIDGVDLADLVLKHFDDLDEGYKKLLPIRRKKDFNLEDLFEAETPPPTKKVQ